MMGFWDGSGISWTVSKQYAPRSSGAARGEASPLWVDVQKLCNVCFHCHGTSSYHTTNTMHGRRAKSHVDTQTIQPGLGDFVL